MRETEFLVKNLEKDISLEKIAISEFFKVNIYASKLPASQCSLKNKHCQKRVTIC